MRIIPGINMVVGVEGEMIEVKEPDPILLCNRRVTTIRMELRQSDQKSSIQELINYLISDPDIEDDVKGDARVPEILGHDVFQANEGQDRTRHRAVGEIVMQSQHKGYANQYSNNTELVTTQQGSKYLVRLVRIDESQSEFEYHISYPSIVISQF